MILWVLILTLLIYCHARAGNVCPCTRELAPLCCTSQKQDDGNILLFTFDNPCLAACGSGDFKFPGGNGCEPGKCNCPCPAILAPVCCNGKRYDNTCIYKCGYPLTRKDSDCRPAALFPDCK